MKAINLNGSKYFYKLFLKKDESDPILMTFRVHIFKEVLVPKWRFWFIKSWVRIKKNVNMGLSYGTIEGNIDSLNSMEKQRLIVRPSIKQFIDNRVKLHKQQ